MKKLFLLFFCACILLTGCGKMTDFSSTMLVPSKDIAEPFALAEAECERMFAHLPGLRSPVPTSAAAPTNRMRWSSNSCMNPRRRAVCTASSSIRMRTAIIPSSPTARR